MKRQFKLILSLTVFALLAAAAFPIPASAAPAIISVSPNLIVNNVTNEVTVNGSGFEATSQVTVGSMAVTTTVDTAYTLRIVIPAGFAVGVYDVVITNTSDSTTSTLPAGLTVEAPTPTPQTTSRPIILIDQYTLSVSPISYGQDFTLNVSLDNAGGSTAYGIQVTFTSTDLIMLKNGGVSAGGDLGTAGKSPISQTMTAAASLFGQSRVSVDMNVSYSDDKGTAYTERFTLYFPVSGGGASGGTYSGATATPTGVRRPQLVVMAYSTDVDPLQPGYQFTLSLDVQNVGNVAAKGVTMILGGGSAASGSGTPQGGISGGSGEFTNFAPVGSSNIQSLGDVQPGTTIIATQKLVVNVSTNPGAFPVKIAFSYLDQNGSPVNDEQVITLMVYSLPSVNVSFYQPVGDVYAGQPAMLPLQVVSMSKRSAVLGTMTVTSAGGYVENGESFVGSLDPGGYFMLDAMITPDAPGTLDLVVTIDYVDDFNQPRTLTQTLTLNVLDMPFEPTLDPSYPTDDGGEIIYPSSGETFWQKAWRFLLGLLGLDSSAPVESAPTDFVPTDPVIIEPVPGKG